MIVAAETVNLDAPMPIGSVSTNNVGQASSTGSITAHASSTTSNATLAGWIHGQRRDLALMAAWVPFSLAAWLTIGSPSALATVVATTLLISLAHQPLTLGLIYGDPAQFAVAKKIFTFGPFVFVAAIIFGNWLSLALVGVVAGLWNAEHTLMQRYGLVRIYGRKAGEGQRSDEKPLLFSWLLFALAFAGADGRTPKLLTKVDLGATNESGIEVLQSLQPYARVAMIPLGLFVVWSARRWWRVEQTLETKSIPKYAYLAATGVLFLVMLINPIVGLVGYVGAHALEYIVIVHQALGRRYRGANAEPGGIVGPLVRSPLRSTGLVAVYLVAVTVFLLLVQTLFPATWANVILLTVGGMHVFFDGFIWKLRRPVVANSVAAA